VLVLPPRARAARLPPARLRVRRARRAADGSRRSVKERKSTEQRRSDRAGDAGGTRESNAGPGIGE